MGIRKGLVLETTFAVWPDLVIITIASAFTNNRDTFHQLSLIGGMQPRFIKSITNQSTTISRIKSILNSEKKAKKSLKFVFIAGIYSASHTDSIQIIST